METRNRVISSGAFWLVIIISAMALLGWVLNFLPLASIHNNYIPMAPATAISFIILSAASLISLNKGNNFKQPGILVGLLIAFHFLALFDVLLDYPMGIEQIFGSPVSTDQKFVLGRMSPVTIILFLMCAVAAFVLIKRINKWVKLATYLCFLGLITAFVFDLGYIYRTPLLYNKTIIPPALNTSIAFTVLFSGMMVGFGKEHYPLKLFVGSSVHARLLRNFLPVTIVIILLAAWIDKMVWKNFDEPVIASTIITILSVSALSFFILKFSRRIGNDIDQAMEFRNNAEKAIRESEERYRLISSVATDYAFSTKVLPDGSLELIWVAGAFESISGYTPEEYKARGGWRATIHPDDLAIDDKDIERLQNNEKTQSELRTINREGKIVWVQVYAHPVWDDRTNRLAGIYGAVRNITDRKLAEEKLISSEIRFRELLEEVNLIAVIIDTEGRITFCNNYTLHLTGYNQEELIGQNWFDKMIPESSQDVKDIFNQGLRDGIIIPRYENPIVTKSGKMLDIMWSNVAQRGSDNTFSGIASIGEDITEQKISRNKINELNIDLENRVLERTRELEEKNAELTRMNKLFVGRELRMIELKNKLKELETKINDNNE